MMALSEHTRTYLPDPAPERHGVALCLSGGGFRAALFHLGALRRLNEYGLLSQIDTISSVSGGSILSGHLADRIRQWPAPGNVASDWDARIAAPFREFTGKNLRTWLPLLGLVQQLIPFDVTRGAATRLLARRYQRRLTALRVSEIADRPRFIFCATDLVFGVNWEFDFGQTATGTARFGDYQAGYAHPKRDWRIARAVAASSCFPPFFNPLPTGFRPDHLVGGRYAGRDRRNLVRRIRLTDGGVYDNLGLEPVWKTHRIIMVSDGGGIFKAARDAGLVWRLGRYLAITSNQERALRKRWLISSFARKVTPQASGTQDDPYEMQGAYWGIGSATRHYGMEIGYSEELVQDLIAEIRTDLDAFSPAECAVLENHGYLLAEAAIRAHLGMVLPGPRVSPALEIPHPDWMDETRVKRGLATSGQRKFWGRM